MKRWGRTFPMLLVMLTPFPLSQPARASFTAHMTTAVTAASPKTTRTTVMAIVKSILQRNSGACRFSHGPIVVARVKAGWRVSTKLTLTGRDKPSTTTAVWTVREDNGEAVPANQLTSEISAGCP